MRILFISRKFPPQTGGMEMHSYFLRKNLSCSVDEILLRRSQKHLIWFLPFAFFKGIFLVWRCDVVYVSDGLLAPLAYFLGFLSRKPTVSTIHGLDITYRNFFYQRFNVVALRRLDALIAISDSTRLLAIQHGCLENRITVIPNGVDVERFVLFPSENPHGDFFSGRYSHLRDKHILFTQGRLVKRKGVLWFLEHVFSSLPASVIYCIAGAGPEYERIARFIEEHHWQDRVFLLGKISPRFSAQLFHDSKIFLMPNISVPGDYEGFGIVAGEAAALGAYVVASDIEGIPSAIHDRKNGRLVPSGDADAFRAVICDILDHDPEARIFRDRAMIYTREHFRWHDVAQKYERVFLNFYEI